ncbi:MAG TPA: SH3 domain-containing protein [Thermoanaerobaculia bacterium]|nr:SH3 domain-containing protein [Thermoanaerobaculia bacterium]
MMKALGALLLVAGVSLVLTGCVAEFLAEGVAAEGMAAEGLAAEGLAAEGLAGADLAAAAEAAEMGAARAIASRVAGGELAVSPGVLRGALAELTEGGARRALLDIDGAGAISREGRLLASVDEGGAITRTDGFGRKVLVGRIAEGRIWEVDARGALRHPVGELRGFVPGSGVRLVDDPFSSETRVEILRSHSVVEVLQRRGDWVEIRLVNGQKGWVWSPLVAISALFAVHRRDQHREELSEALVPDGQGDRCLVLVTGQLLRGRPVGRLGSATRLATPDGQTVVVEDELVLRAESCHDNRDLDWSAGSYTVELADGTVLYARSYESRDGVAILTLADGAKVFLAQSLVQGDPVPPWMNEEVTPRGDGETAAAPEPVRWPVLARSMSFGESLPRPAYTVSPSRTEDVLSRRLEAAEPWAAPRRGGFGFGGGSAAAPPAARFEGPGFTSPGRERWSGGGRSPGFPRPATPRPWSGGSRAGEPPGFLGPRPGGGPLPRLPRPASPPLRSGAPEPNGAPAFRRPGPNEVPPGQGARPSLPPGAGQTRRPGPPASWAGPPRQGAAPPAPPPRRRGTPPPGGRTRPPGPG